METHDQQVIWSSSEAEWRTPPQLYDRLHAEFHFGLDAAATAANSCHKYYLGPDHPDPARRDAQAHTCGWLDCTEYGDVPLPIWINPPYSRKLLRETGNPSFDISQWAATCALQAAKGATVVGLFPYSVQTEWWYAWVRHGIYKAREIRTIPHRVSYLRPDGSPAGNAGGNSCVIIWQPPCNYIGDWQPAERVWDYR